MGVDWGGSVLGRFGVVGITGVRGGFVMADELLLRIEPAPTSKT